MRAAEENLSSEVHNFGLQLITLEVEPVDEVALFAQFDKLICNFVFKLLDDYLEPPRRHREFCTEQIFIGLDFGNRIAEGVVRSARDVR
jgi:hypothetical protein